MYQSEITELNNTWVEKELANMVKADFPQLTGMTLSYREWLSLINTHLTTLYGRFADWSNNLGLFEYDLGRRQNSSLIVNNVEDLLTIDEKTISLTLQCEEQNKALADKAVQYINEFKQKNDICSLTSAAEILGVLPYEPGDPKEQSQGALNRYYVVFPKDSTERHNLRNHVLTDYSKIGLLGLIVSLMASLYDESTLFSYPFWGTTPTQRRGKIFWRGENAYYGTSLASLYRSTEFKTLPPEVFECIRKMRQDTCGELFDQLEAPLSWSKKISNVNYLALMQHYGLRTEMLDVTSDFKTALFFACCKWIPADTDKRIISYGHWEPLNNCDFENKDSRKSVASLGGDSRYGVLYQEPVEIEDLMWLVVNNPAAETLFGTTEDGLDKGQREYLAALNHIIPVGYQPFQRCKSQHAYMLVEDGVIDCLKSVRFEKAKFRLSEDICDWVYHEMDSGKKIYPEGDSIPDIGPYIEKIANSHVFNKSEFDHYCEGRKMIIADKDRLKENLKSHGYYIRDTDIKPLTEKEAEEINRQYTFGDAVKTSGINFKPKAQGVYII